MVEFTKTQLGIGFGAAAAVGAAIIRGMDKVWVRITSGNSQLQTELLKALHESTQAQVQIAATVAALSAKIDLLIQAIPKRQGDVA